MAVPVVFAVSVSPPRKPLLIVTVAPARSWPLESAAVAPASTTTGPAFWLYVTPAPAVTVRVASKTRLAGLGAPLAPEHVDAPDTLANGAEPSRAPRWFPRLTAVELFRCSVAR